jgi:hypothetical protein
MKDMLKSSQYLIIWVTFLSDDAGITFVDIWYDFCFAKLAITVFA